MAKVLVVDDSPTEIYQFKDMLEGMNFEVITADNGRAAIEIAASEQPDIVLMDIVMPDMNGFQATRQLSKEARTKNIPVVIVSSKDQETDKVWGERQGAKGYITKPVKPEELLKIIKSLI